MNRNIFLMTSIALVAVSLVFTSCGANKKLTMENESLTSRLQMSTAKNADLESQLQKAMVELDARNGEVADLTKQVDTKAKDLQSLTGELASVTKERDGLDIRITEQTQELEKSAAEQEALLKTIDDLKSTLRARGDELSKQLAELTDKKQNLDKQVVGLQSDLGASRRKNDALAAQMDDLNKKISDQSAQLDGLKIELVKATAQRDQLAAQVTDLTSRVASLSTEKGSLQVKLDDLNRQAEAVVAAQEKEKKKMESTYEKLLSSLKSEVDQQTIQIKSYQDALTISMMEKIFFDSGKADVKPEGLNVLKRLGPILKELPDKIVRIEGHTDDVPIGAPLQAKYPSNWELGAARSGAVVRYLIKEGVDPQRLVVVSYAFYRPLLPNTSNDNRAKNRRIEIVLIDRSLYEKMELKQSGAAAQ